MKSKISDKRFDQQVASLILFLGKRTYRRCSLAIVLLAVSGCFPSEEPNSTSEDPKSTSQNQKRTDPTASDSKPDHQTDNADRTTQFRTLLKRDDLSSAKELLSQWMIADGDDPQVQCFAAQLASKEGRFRDAIRQLKSIPLAPDSDLWLDSQRLVSEIAFNAPAAITGSETFVWRRLEMRLQKQPQRIELRNCLIRLLNRMGHRHRACLHLDWLCSSGRASREQLFELLSRRSSVPLEGLSKSLPSNDDALPSDYPLATARRSYTSRQYQRAYEILAPYQKEGWPHPEFAALFGLVLADGQRFDEMPGWLNACPKNVSDYAEYWSALGLLLKSESDFTNAIGALITAIEIDPTHYKDYRQLSFCLTKIGQDQLAERVMDRANQVEGTLIQAIMSQSQTPGEKYLAALSMSLNKLGRPFEYLAWQESLAKNAGANPNFTLQIQRKRSEFLSIPDFREIVIEDRRMEISSTEFPKPNRTNLQSLSVWKIKPSRRTGEANDESVPSVELVDVAEEVGLVFRFQNHREPKTFNLRIHESLGGGVGVVDFDRDGWPDVYFCQASGAPPAEKAKLSNQLFRNLDGTFRPVTSVSVTSDFGYSTGIAVGDVNQDGFQDLLIGALGQNRLLLNQGDGTFEEQALTNQRDPRFTSSLAIADLTGDHLPEIIECNYVKESQIYKIDPAPANGIPKGTSPLDHDAASDRVLIALPDGSYQATELESEGTSAAASLGLVVTDFDDRPGNEVFIANDAYPNRFWSKVNASDSVGDSLGDVKNEATMKRFDEYGWVEKASATGLALDHASIQTAAMGVAAGDFDENGRIDLHITNFWEQSSTLYLQQAIDRFVDFAPRFQLVGATYSMLGFGTQAIDVNRDGRLDLVVLNGHIEDYSALGHPFRMVPQVLLGNSTNFESQSKPKNGFFSKPGLGRSLARIDFNRDGRMDLVTSQLDESAALLANQTDPAGRMVRFQLVGTESERDAVGTKVIVQWGDETKVGWSTAGDGYFSSNEKVIEITSSLPAPLDQVTVIWPTGKQQNFDKLQTNRTYLIREGMQPYLCSPPTR